MSLLLFLQDPTLYDFQSESWLGLSQLFIGFVLNLIALSIILAFLYPRRSQPSITSLGLVISNMVVFAIGYLTAQPLAAIGLSICLVLGYAILNQRKALSEEVNNWLLMVLMCILGCINAMIGVVNVFELLVLNILLVCVPLLTYWLSNRRTQYVQQLITIDDLSLLKPEKKANLYQYLEAQTGSVIKKMEVVTINLAMNMAALRIDTLPGTVKQAPAHTTKANETSEQKIKHENIYPKPNEEEEKAIQEMMYQANKKKKIILRNPDSKEEMNQLLGS